MNLIYDAINISLLLVSATHTMMIFLPQQTLNYDKFYTGNETSLCFEGRCV